MSTAKKRLSFSTVALSIFALFFICIIFLIDLKVSVNVAVGNFYVLVILYSYLLNIKNANLYLAIICTTLLLIANHSELIEGSQNDPNKLNIAFILVPIWVCAALIGIAKKSLHELDETLHKKRSIIDKKTADLQGLNLELEQKVFERTAELGAKNQALEEFAYAASHDLQEPLNTINNFSELIKGKHHELPKQKLEEYISYVAASSKRLKSLIQDLLDHTQIDYSIKFEEINPETVVKSIMDDLKQLLDANKAIIEIKKLPKIKGDPSYIRLLFQNLISNAIKFGRAEVLNEIVLEAKESESEIIFSISDNGIGIPKEKQGEIFTVFRRLHNNSKYQGNGIGLANCKKIVEYHGGEIWVESELDKGSTFYIRLLK